MASISVYLCMNISSTHNRKSVYKYGLSFGLSMYERVLSSFFFKLLSFSKYNLNTSGVWCSHIMKKTRDAIASLFFLFLCILSSYFIVYYCLLPRVANAATSPWCPNRVTFISVTLLIFLLTLLFFFYCLLPRVSDAATSWRRRAPWCRA